VSPFLGNIAVISTSNLGIFVKKLEFLGDFYELGLVALSGPLNSVDLYCVRQVTSTDSFFCKTWT
jgi:hypothetical protein